MRSSELYSADMGNELPYGERKEWKEGNTWKMKWLKELPEHIPAHCWRRLQWRCFWG
ncbi:hypothetical protein SBA5_880031 [Candidatus Sulfotelmatomonas gaucii]|uniref:Uncharacterized protein n=1 Tax=Candidatus Sulfuritelmatomonas gaucii TaxID=2043161 RepID=A0A2N9M790_9BACT|nr:hypothetical protein SBA5_880031 [Candidatus Sulfotelmatomonas gaucii]